MIDYSKDWKDYELIDCGDGMKYERWQNTFLLRPDPQAIWPLREIYQNIDAVYNRSTSGGGQWEYKTKLPESWQISYKDLKFKIKPTNFKHTGLFPEQALNWDWIKQRIEQKEIAEFRVLNLFAYTGAASVAAAKAGAKVVHVDAAKGMINWAKENARLSAIDENAIRYIVDDCFKFVKREQRRENTYHGIIMDPPSYGRGKNKEVWKFEDHIYNFLKEVLQLLDTNASFLLINSYTTGLSNQVLVNMISDLKSSNNTKIYGNDLGLNITNRDMILPCGMYARWESK
jgi:23S rRNA (cytosine1962-C5)-methyltransferase